LILLSINTTEVTYTHRETRGIDSTAFMSIDLSEFGRGFYCGIPDDLFIHLSDPHFGVKVICIFVIVTFMLSHSSFQVKSNL